MKKPVATVNIKTLKSLTLKYLNHFYGGFLCNSHEQKHFKNTFLMIYDAFLKLHTF